MRQTLFFTLSFTLICSLGFAQFSRKADYKNEEDSKIVVTDREGNVVKMTNFDDFKKEGWDEKEKKGKSGSLSKEEKLAEKEQKNKIKQQEKKAKKKYSKRPDFDTFEDELLYDINPDDFAEKKSVNKTIPEEHTREYLPYIYNPKNRSVSNDLKMKVGKDVADEFRLYAYRNHPDVDSNNAAIRMPTFRDEKSKNDFRFEKAVELMENGFFSTALPLLLEIRRGDTKNPDINQWIGICYLNGYNNQCRSIPYFREAASNTNLDYVEYEAPKVAGNDVDAILLLAKAYQRCGKLHDAEATFRTYIEAVKNEKKYAASLSVAKMHLLQLSQAERLLGQRGRQFETTNLSEINTLYAEIAARPVGNNTLLFASAKEPDQFPTLINFKEGRFFTDIYRTQRTGNGWDKPEALVVNTPIDDIPLGANSENGKLFYHSYSADSSNVYIAEKNFETFKEGFAIFKAPPFLDFRNTYSITSDGRTLIFAAQDKEGFGGLDLFVTTLNTDGTWKDPVNLGETVNTPFNEITPYIHPNGRTLYFSRDGNESVGGFDVFKSELSAFNKWDKAENMGFSTNTFGDDIFYSVTPDGHYGYVSRKGGAGDFDIFEINFFSTNPTLGSNSEKSVTNERGDLLLTNLVTGKAKWYAINRANGKYNLILEPCVNYKLEWYKQSRVFKQETFMTPCNVESNSLSFDPNNDLGKIQVRLNESGKGNYNDPNEKLPNAWQVLVDGKPYRFENFSIQLKDETGLIFHNTKLDRMGNFRLPDLNFQEPTFMVQVIDMDICDRLSIKNLSGKDKELRYPECFTK